MTEDPVSDTWEAGDPYERYIGRWSRRVAPRFLQWLEIPANQRWLDVGCGTGALSAAILSHTAPAAVTAVETSEGFLAKASEHLGGRVTTRVGSAAELPLDAGSVDVAVSGLVLNFTPDVAAALAEQSRVTSAGGTVAAYVWDYADGMEFLRLFWDAAIELDPAAAILDEGARFPHCRPDALTAAFREAGLGNVAVTPIDIDTLRRLRRPVEPLPRRAGSRPVIRRLPRRRVAHSPARPGPRSRPDPDRWLDRASRPSLGGARVHGWVAGADQSNPLPIGRGTTPGTKAGPSGRPSTMTPKVCPAARCT